MIPDVKPLIDVANFALALGAIIYAWFASRSREVSVKFDDVESRFKTGSDRMDRIEMRLSRLEQTVAGLPSKDDIHKIELHMERMAGAMSRMEAVLEGNQQIMGRLETIVTRHEDHLLKGSK